MKCIDRLKNEYPKDYNPAFPGGSMSCPHYYGYAEGLCGTEESANDDTCTRCWQQECLKNVPKKPCEDGDIVFTILGTKVKSNKARRVRILDGKWQALAHYKYVYQEIGKDCFTLEQIRKISEELRRNLYG